jgi:acyl-CoA thioesterase FadM
MMESGRIGHAEQVLRPILGTKEFLDFVNGQGLGPILKSISINYRAPTWFPDEIIIATRIKMDSLKSDRFTQECIMISEAQEITVASSGNI